MVPSAGLACLPINNGVITRNGNKKKKKIHLDNSGKKKKEKHTYTWVKEQFNSALTAPLHKHGVTRLFSFGLKFLL